MVRRGRMAGGMLLAVSVVLGSVAGAPVAEAQGANRSHRAARLRATGHALVAAGDSGSAVAYFRDAIGVDANDALSFAALGHVYLARGSVGDALEAFSIGLRRRPDHAALWRGLAQALEARGALSEAADALRELLRREPDDMEGHFALGALARRRGTWSESLTAYRRVLDLRAGGVQLTPERLRDAQRYVAALSVLTRGLDPVRTQRVCDRESSVRRALARCGQL